MQYLSITDIQCKTHPYTMGKKKQKQLHNFMTFNSAETQGVNSFFFFSSTGMWTVVPQAYLNVIKNSHFICNPRRKQFSRLEYYLFPIYPMQVCMTCKTMQDQSKQMHGSIRLEHSQLVRSNKNLQWQKSLTSSCLSSSSLSALAVHSWSCQYNTRNAFGNHFRPDSTCRST